MTVTIGRFSTGNAFDYSASGDDVTINGTFSGDTDDARAARMQLLGLAAGDVVPFTSTDLPELDGFYYMAGTASVSPSAVMLSNGYFEYSVSLTRPPGGYGVGTFEVTSLAALRPNDNTVTDWSREVYWPGSAAWSSLPSSGADTDRTDLIGAHDSSPTAGMELFRYRIGPGDYFEGAATIEIKIGSSWYPLVGTHLPAGLTADEVRFGNAQWRSVLEDVSSTVAFWTDCYNGASWDTDEARWGVAADGDGCDEAIAPIILRNDPAGVALRYYVTDTSGYSEGGPVVDVSCARGAVGVEGVIFEPGVSNSITTDQTGATNNDYGVVQGSPAGSDPAYYLVADDVDGRSASSVTIGADAVTPAFAAGFSRVADGHAQEGHDAFYGSNATSQRLVLP